MFYISIDNDFHTEIAINYINTFKLDKKNITFISNKSIRNSAIYNIGFPIIEIPGHPFSAGCGFKKLLTYIRTIKQHSLLRKIFKFGPDDILFVLTEYQINNAYLAKMIKKSGGRVYLADEGIGFYLNNHIWHKKNIRIKDTVFLAAYNLIFLLFCLPIEAKKGQEGKMFVSIDDNLIDKLFSSIKIKIERSIKTIQYRRILKINKNGKKSNVKSVVYLASNFECFGLKKEEKDIAEKAIRYLINVYDKVYIKIHPQDASGKTELYFFYNSFKQKNVNIISNKLTSNQAITKIKPSLIVGTFSSSLVDAFIAGHNVIFLYQLLPKIKELELCSLILRDFNYIKMSSINDIKKYI